MCCRRPWSHPRPSHWHFSPFSPAGMPAEEGGLWAHEPEISRRIERDGRESWALCAFLAPSLSTLTHPFAVVYIHTGALVCFVPPCIYLSTAGTARPAAAQDRNVIFFFLDSSTPLPNEIFFFHQCPNKLFCLYIIDCVCVCVCIHLLGQCCQGFDLHSSSSIAVTTTTTVRVLQMPSTGTRQQDKHTTPHSRRESL